MNNAISSSSPSLRSQRRSDQMLMELLALNEEMITQLRVERADTSDPMDFIAGMIRQHENAAARLQNQLERHRSDAGNISLAASSEQSLNQEPIP